MRKPRALELHAFSTDDPLARLKRPGSQAAYLRRYLDDLGAATVLEEPYYFDRDYLAEFAAFYSTSAAGYPNVCRRLHYFSAEIDRPFIEAALGGDVAASETLQRTYLGFVVLRPIPGAPLGRTVLRWYPDRDRDTTPRIISPSRRYLAHVAGLRLQVDGLPWQQQDAAVGACATIALWSMLCSSAHDGHHALPTTAAITRAAHQTASLGQRVFPSDGLTIEQLCEAIKEHGLQPVVVPGDRRLGAGRAFSVERFKASCSALLRSGFPVIITGLLRRRSGESMGQHAVCGVGFRSAAPMPASPGTAEHQDSAIQFLYAHDDNLGPNVRLEIGSDADACVTLRPVAPVLATPPSLPDPTLSHPEMIPSNLIVAVPEDLRMSPDSLHESGLLMTELLSWVLEQVAAKASHPPAPGLTVSTRIALLRDYLGQDLAQVLGADPRRLAQTRLRLVEEVPPMSKHLGIVRAGEGARPLFDVLYDTTDSIPNQPVYAHVVYEPALLPYLDVVAQSFAFDLGVRIVAA